MNIIVGLIPAIVGGMVPIVVSKIGGSPNQQILGTTLGAFIFGLILYLTQNPYINTTIFWSSFFSGAFWGFGQFFQYKSFTKISVSVAMPISTALQIVLTSMVGVFFFGEWGDHAMYGLVAIIVIVLGVYLTSHKVKKNKNDNQHLMAGILFSGISVIGYLGYSTLPKYYNLNAMSAFFPQVMGMFFMALLISGKKVLSNLTNKKAVFNIITGLLFSLAALSYLFSIQFNGMAKAFVFSQLSVVIATFGGIFILKEDKESKELLLTMIGLTMVVSGAVYIGTL